jgi:hypothetical protein
MKKKERLYSVSKSICIIASILALFAAIIGCSGNDDAHDEMPPDFVLYIENGSLEFASSRCQFSESTGVISNVQYDMVGRKKSYSLEITINDGNCSGESYLIYVYDIQYDNLGSLKGAKYDYNDTTYTALDDPPDWVGSDFLYIPEKTITIDGDSNDWQGIEPLITDSAGDVITYSGIDITRIYLAQDNNYLYVKLDLVGDELPQNEWIGYGIYLFAIIPGRYSFAISVFYDQIDNPSPTLWNITGIEGDEYYPPSRQISASIELVWNTGVIEMACPIEFIIEDSYNLNCVAQYTVNKDWTNAEKDNCEDVFVYF